MGSYEEQGRAVNHMKAGLTTADRVVTVRLQSVWNPNAAFWAFSNAL